MDQSSACLLFQSCLHACLSESCADSSLTLHTGLKVIDTSSALVYSRGRSHGHGSVAKGIRAPCSDNRLGVHPRPIRARSHSVFVSCRWEIGDWEENNEIKNVSPPPPPDSREIANPQIAARNADWSPCFFFGHASSKKKSPC